jgi:hypothetical protein
VTHGSAARGWAGRAVLPDPASHAAKYPMGIKSHNGSLNKLQWLNEKRKKRKKE